MGLRENIDFSLHLVTFFCAFLSFLFFLAARKYTPDWRARRTHKRHLKNTREKLTGNDKSKVETHGRKRFVAALPLIPFATAYVVVRVLWDVFQILVFCFLDMVLESISQSINGLNRVAKQAYTGVHWLVTSARIREQLEALAIAFVEGSVVWVFTKGYPAVVSAVDWCQRMATSFRSWWSVRGGPMTRDAVESLVLGVLVPAYGAAREFTIAGIARAVWFSLRVWEATCVVGRDLAEDARICYFMAVRAYSWVVSNDRWWAQPQWVDRTTLALAWAYGLIVSLVECGRRPLEALSLVVWKAANGASATIVAFAQSASRSIHASIDFLSNAWIRMDFSRVTLILHQVGSRVYSEATQALAFVLVGVSMVHYSTVQMIQSITQYSYQAIEVGRVLYWRFVEYAAPFGLLVYNASMTAWSTVQETAQKAFPVFRKAAHKVGVGAAVYARALGQMIKNAGIPIYCGLCAHVNLRRVSEFALRYGSSIWEYSKAASSDIWDWIVGHVCKAGIMLWPILMARWGEAVQASREMARLLAALVDSLVAIAGDLVLDFARSRTVHSQTNEEIRGKCDS